MDGKSGFVLYIDAYGVHYFLHNIVDYLFSYFVILHNIKGWLFRKVINSKNDFRQRGGGFRNVLLMNKCELSNELADEL